jgi:hypothetical protein
VVQPFFEEINPSVLVSTIDVYQRMGCWDGDTAVPPQTYEKLLDAFLYSWGTQKTPAVFQPETGR